MKLSRRNTLFKVLNGFGVRVIIYFAIFILMISYTSIVDAEECPPEVTATQYWTQGSGENVIPSSLLSRSLAGLISTVEIATEMYYPGWELTRTSPTDGSQAPICYMLTIDGEIWQSPFGRDPNCGAYFYPYGVGVCPSGYTLDYDQCIRTEQNSKICQEKEKEPGPPPFCAAGNPINQGTGNKFQIETDYTGNGHYPLIFKRFYNSINVPLARIGSQWRSNYDRSVYLASVYPDEENKAIAIRPDGKSFLFNLVNGNWMSDADVTDRLERLPNGWRYTSGHNDEVEVYDTNGRLISISNRAGLTQTLSYDNGGKLISVTDSFGRSLAFGYDNLNRLSTMTDPTGRIHLYNYDANNNLISVTYPDNTVRNYHYENPNFLYALTGITDENGIRYATYTYDDQGRAISSEHTGGVGRVTLTYNSDGSTTVTDSRGASHTYRFETILGVVRSTAVEGGPCSSCGNTATTTYDVNGFISNKTDFNGNITQYVHNARGLEVSRSEAFGTSQERTITTEWHPIFRLPIRINEAGRITNFTYDSNGNLLTITDPLGADTSFTYSTLGQMTSITDPTGAITYLTYDVRGNLATIVDPLGRMSSFTYDGQGNLLTTTDALSKTSQYAYDLRNRLTQVRDAIASLTEYGYDNTGNLIVVTDANQHTTNHWYDGARRLLQAVNAIGQTTTYGYDSENNLTSRTDANGQITTYTYNSYNQLTQITYTNNSQTTFTYDAGGRLTYANNTSATYTVTYDSLNQITQISDQSNRTLTYTYNQTARRTSRTDSWGITTYQYDVAGRLIALTDPWNHTWTFTYDATGRRISFSRPNGLSTTYSYDAAGQLRTIDHTGIGVWQYMYDAVGDRTQMTIPTGTHTYTYDAINRLTTDSHPAGQGETFSYDPVGNRLTDATADYNYNAANRLLTKTGIGFTHDANGNMAGKTDASGTTTYLYDSNNQLVQIADNGGVIATYTYDPFGRRISKSTATDTIYYVYDGEDILAEVDDAGNLITYYIHGPGIDEPIAMIRGGQTYYYHADGLGSIIAITDANRNVVQRYEYNSFGEITYQQDPNFKQPYTYTGREYDEESGLYYYRARYYDAKVGRFITEDPIGFSGGINFYSYVGNNPVNFIDPTGEVVIALPCIANPACVGAVLAGGAAIITAIRNLPPPPPSPPDDNCKKPCEEQYNNDIQECQGRWPKDPGKRSSCYQHAMTRKVLCEQGLPIPPLQP